MTEPINPYEAPSRNTPLPPGQRFRPTFKTPPWLLSIGACFVLQVIFVFVAPVVSERIPYPPGAVLIAINTVLFLALSMGCGLCYPAMIAHGLIQCMNAISWAVIPLLIWFSTGLLSSGDILFTATTASLFAVGVAIIVQAMALLQRLSRQRLSRP